MKQVDARIAIVTGATGGFGEGIARLFAAEGARMVVADLGPVRVQRVERCGRPAVEVGGR